jgi:hypothetical protein
MKPETTGDSLPVCSDGQYLRFMEGHVVAMRQQDCVLQDATFSLMVYAGYAWDGASIPRYLWWLFGKPLSPEFRLASLWHDRLCELSECIEDRIIADAVFLRLLKDAGVKKWRRVAMWAGVRFYATFVWRFKRWLQKR